MANILSIILDATATPVKKAMEEVDKSVKSVEKSVVSFMKKHKMAFLAMTAAVAGVSAAMIVGTKRALRYGLEIDALRKKTGLSAESAARLRYAMEQEHGSLEALSNAIPILSRRIIDASAGLETYTRAFDRAGISIRDTEGNIREAQDIFLDLADFMASGTSNTVKMATAQELLGRGGKELLPVMRLGREALERLGDEAERIGIVMSTEDVIAMKHFDDSMLKLRYSIKGVFLIIARSLAPVLEGIADWAADRLPTIRSDVEKTTESVISRMIAVGGILDKVASAWFWVKTGIESVLTLLGSVASTFEDVILGIVGYIKYLWDTIVHEGSIAFLWVEDQLRGVISRIKAAMADFMADMISQWIKLDIVPVKVRKASGKVISSLRDIQEEALKTTGRTYSEIRKTFEKQVPAVTNEAVKHFEAVGDEFADNFSGILDKVEERESGFFESTMKDIRKYINEAREVVSVAAEEETEKVSQELEDFRGDQKSAWETYTESLKTSIQDTTITITSIVKSIQSAFSSVIFNMIAESKSFKDSVSAVWKDLRRAILQAITDMIAKWIVFKTLGGFGLLGKGGAVPSLQKGGPVPIIAHAGEYVIPAGVVDRIRKTRAVPTELVSAIAEGRSPRLASYQAGGMIGGGISPAVNVGGISISVSQVPGEDVDTLLERIGTAVENNLASGVATAMKIFNKGQERQGEAV